MDDSRLLERRITLQDKSQSVKLQSDLMRQYNHVISCYNTEDNKVGSFQLEPMKENWFYTKFWRIASYPCYLLIFELLIMVPGLGVLSFLWLLLSTIHYFRGLIVFKRNQRVVSDPFQNMVFCPEICQASGVTNKFVEIKPQDLEGYAFNQEIKKGLKLKEFQGSISFMVYNTEFWNYYHAYCKKKVAHIFILLLGMVLVGVQAYVVYLFYKGTFEFKLEEDSA